MCSFLDFTTLCEISIHRLDTLHLFNQFILILFISLIPSLKMRQKSDCIFFNHFFFHWDTWWPNYCGKRVWTTLYWQLKCVSTFYTLTRVYHSIEIRIEFGEILCTLECHFDLYFIHLFTSISCHWSVDTFFFFYYCVRWKKCFVFDYQPIQIKSK